MSESDSDQFASADEDSVDASPLPTTNVSNSSSFKEQLLAASAPPSHPPSNAVQTPEAAAPVATQSTLSSWSTWGVGWGQSVFQVAQSSVGTLATQMYDCVEQVLDAPPPEKLAEDDIELSVQKEEPPPPKVEQNPETANTSSSAVANPSWWSFGGLSGVVSKTSLSLANEGLNMLENIGKKTMDALHETDPGFQRTKSMLKPISLKTPTLTETIREAQQNAPSGTMSESTAAESTLSASELMEQLRTVAGDCDRQTELHISTLPTDSLKKVRETLRMIKTLTRQLVDRDFTDDQRHGLSQLDDDVTHDLHEALQLKQASAAFTIRQTTGHERFHNFETIKTTSTTLDDISAQSKQWLDALHLANLTLFHQCQTALMRKSYEIHDWPLCINSIFRVLELCLLDVNHVREECIQWIKAQRNEENRRRISEHVTSVLVDSDHAVAMVKDSTHCLQSALCFAFVTSSGNK